jgi:hypothetical protein
MFECRTGRRTNQRHAETSTCSSCDIPRKATQEGTNGSFFEPSCAPASPARATPLMYVVATCVLRSLLTVATDMIFLDLSIGGRSPADQCDYKSESDELIPVPVDLVHSEHVEFVLADTYVGSLPVERALLLLAFGGGRSKTNTIGPLLESREHLRCSSSCMQV